MVVVTIIFSIIGSLQLFSEPYLLHNIAPAQISNSYAKLLRLFARLLEPAI